MKKFVFIAVIVIVVTISIYSKKVDTKYAVEYAQVFGSYDIKKVDQYLDKETQITYNGVTNTYENLRENIISAFEENLYELPRDGSYGYGDDIFIDGIQTIGIQVYVNSTEYSSEFVSMELERRWVISYNIRSITSSDDFFGYLFFGITK